MNGKLTGATGNRLEARSLVMTHIAEMGNGSWKGISLGKQASGTGYEFAFSLFFHPFVTVAPTYPKNQIVKRLFYDESGKVLISFFLLCIHGPELFKFDR